MAVAAAVGGAASTCAVALLATSGWLIDRAAQRPGSVLALSMATASVRGFALGRGSLRYGERVLSHDAALRMLTRLRLRLYRSLVVLVPGAVAHSADVLGRMVDDAEAAQWLWLRLMLPGVGAAITIVVALALAVHLLPAAAVVLGVGLLAGAVGPPALAWGHDRRGRAGSARLRADLSTAVVDLVYGAPDIVAYGAEDQFLARARDADAGLARLGRRLASTGGLAAAAAFVISGATLSAVILVSAAAVHAGRLPAVDLAALCLLALAAHDPLGALTAGAAEAGADVESARRVADILSTPAPVCDPTVAEPVPGGVPELRLERATVRYDDGRLGLDGMELWLAPGEKVALVGPSGCGKSTVGAVLARFRNLDGGRFTVGGVDACRLNQDDVRRIVGLVPQEVHVFNGTVRDNLRLGRPDATESELRSCLDRVGLGDWARGLTDGLDTPVGERGSALSGGERRRLGVARALLADPPVLVLDEPTGGVDNDTAEEMMRDLIGAAGERSVLIMTHDRAGLGGVDRVVCLRRGRVSGVAPDEHGGTGGDGGSRPRHEHAEARPG